jgi:hypothetical protein
LISRVIECYAESSSQNSLLSGNIGSFQGKIEVGNLRKKGGGPFIIALLRFDVVGGGGVKFPEIEVLSITTILSVSISVW